MNFSDHLARGEEIAGNGAALARALKISEANYSSMKAGRRSMPETALAMLAALINEDFGVVVATHNASRATTPEEKAFWLPFAKAGQIGARAAVMLAACGVGLMTNGLPQGLSDTAKVSAPAPEAAPQLAFASKPVFIM